MAGSEPTNHSLFSNRPCPLLPRRHLLVHHRALAQLSTYIITQLRPVKEKLAKQLHKRDEGQVSTYDEDIVRLRYIEERIKIP